MAFVELSLPGAAGWRKKSGNAAADHTDAAPRFPRLFAALQERRRSADTRRFPVSPVRRMGNRRRAERKGNQIRSLGGDFVKKRVFGTLLAAALLPACLPTVLASEPAIFQGHIADSMLTEEEPSIIQGRIVDGVPADSGDSAAPGILSAAGVFTVTFDPNGSGATCPISSKRVTDGRAYGQLPVPTRPGYRFLGWYADAPGLWINANTAAHLTADQTLYAQWEPLLYIVTLDPNGGTVRSGTLTVTEDGLYGELPVPSWGGHSFDGWFTALHGGSRVESGAAVLISGNHTLYALWTETAASDASQPAAGQYGVPSYLDTTDEGGWLFFDDVPVSSSYYNAVNWAVQRGITSGTSPYTFSPNDPCRAKHILTFLWRANGSPEPKSQNALPGFSGKSVLWASEQGLIVPDLYQPETPSTRAEAVTYLWKLAGSPKVSRGELSSSLNRFRDVSTDNACAQAVAWAVNRGITYGTTDTTFSPNRTCTRGQIVTFLYRCYTR